MRVAGDELMHRKARQAGAGVAPGGRGQGAWNKVPRQVARVAVERQVAVAEAVIDLQVPVVRVTRLGRIEKKVIAQARQVRRGKNSQKVTAGRMWS